MVSNCANPECATPLLRLRDGKLFQFEVKSISVPCVDESSAMASEVPVRQVAHYWLCGSCADQMSLVLEINAVRLVQTSQPAPVQNHRGYSAVAH